MARPRIQSFEEFWPFYLREHSKPLTRTLHFIGSTIGLLVVLGAIATRQLYYAPLGLIPGYGFAWFSHFVIEKNRPASFSYPLWSFIADWKMWACILTGRIRSEVQRSVGAS